MEPVDQFEDVQETLAMREGQDCAPCPDDLTWPEVTKAFGTGLFIIALAIVFCHYGGRAWKYILG